MSTPDVRVRLSPEGIKEVIAALREVQKESGKAAKSAAGGVNVLTNAVRDLKTLLPAIGLAAAVGGFLALSKQALDTADKTGKLQQKIGGTVEEISGLTLAFRTNESDQDGLQKSLLKTANFLGDVAAGNEKALTTLTRLGIKAKEFTQLTTPRALELIAKRLAAIPPGADRAAAAADVFGDKIAGDLLTALNAVGTQGIDPFIAKAKELGVLIDGDLATAAARANDALTIVKIQAEGLATQFESGLAPAVATAMEEFTKAVTGDGVNGMKEFGEIVGFIIKSVVLLFIGMGKVIAAETAKIASFVEAVADASKALLKRDFGGAAEALRADARRRAAINEGLANDIEDSRKRLFSAPEPAARPTTGTGAGILPSVNDDAKKTAQARATFIRQALQDELKLQQEAFKTQEQENKNAFGANLISLAAFYDRRRDLITRNTQAEIASLRLERQAVLAAATGDNAPKTDAERIKLKQDLAKITQQIHVAELSGERELQQLQADRVEAVKALSKEQLALDTKLADLEGNRHKVFENNLAQEIQQVRDLGARAGQTADEIEAQVTRLTNASTAKFDFEEATRAGEAALTAFNRDADQIRRDQESGVISQIEGEQRLIELEQSRLEVLRELAKQMLAAAEATGSPDQIAKAQEFAASIDQISASYKNATDAGAALRNGTINSLQEGFESLLANADKIKSVGDAFKQLAITVVASLQRIVAEILARQAILALVRAFGGSFGAGAGSATQAGSGITGSTAGLAQHGGRIRGYAGGGDVRGKALPIAGPDKIPILAQEGEFMVKRSKVMEPGALRFLRSWNGSQMSLAQMMRVPRFAAGGQIGAPKGTPGGAAAGGDRGLRIVNVLDPNLIADAVASSSGERAVMNVISKNSVSIKRLLGAR